MKELAVRERCRGKPDILTSTVIERFSAFLDVSEVTLRSYKSGIATFMNYLQAQGIRQPAREHVADFKKALVDTGRKPATIALYLSALRRFFDWTATEGLYPNITVGVKSPKQDKGHKRDFMSATAIQETLKGIDRYTLELYFMFRAKAELPRPIM